MLSLDNHHEAYILADYCTRHLALDLIEAFYKKKKKRFLDAGEIKITTTSTNTGFQYHTEKSTKHKLVYYILDKLNTQIYK